MIKAIKKYFKENKEARKNYTLCKNNLAFYMDITKAEVKNKLCYSTISSNVFYCRRGSGASRFVSIVSTIEALREEGLRIIVVKGSASKRIFNVIYKEDMPNIFSINNYTVHFTNGSTITYMTDKELACQSRGLDVDHIYFDDYNQLDISKDANVMKRLDHIRKTKMYRDKAIYE